MRHDFGSDVDKLPFVGREDAKRRFDLSVNSPSISWRKVLVFWGVGGIGKSWLRKEMAKTRAKGESGGLRIPYALYEIEAREFPAMNIHLPLIKFAADLKKFGIRFPKFESFINAYGGEIDTSLPISQTNKLLLAFFAMFLTAVGTYYSSLLKQPFTAYPFFALFGWLTTLGLGIILLAKKFSVIERIARWLGGSIYEEELRKGRKSDGGQSETMLKAFFDDLDVYFLKAQKRREIRRKIAEKWLRKKPEYVPSCQLVLFLDATHYDEKRPVITFEDGVPDCLHDLVTECVRRNILLVVSLRDELRRMPSLSNDQKNYFEEYEIKGITPDEARYYLNHASISSDLQEDIIACCDQEDFKIESKRPLCHPETLKWCRHLAKTESKEFFRSLRQELPLNRRKKLISRFLWLIQDKQIESWLRYLSLTPRFDEGAAKVVAIHLFGHDKGKEGWPSLISTSLLSEVANSGTPFYRMNSVLQTMLRSDVEVVAEKEDQLNLHRTLYRYWKGKSKRLAFYHQWWSAPEIALKEWQENFNVAMKQGHVILVQDYLSLWNDLDWDDSESGLIDVSLWVRAHLILGVALAEFGFAQSQGLLPILDKSFELDKAVIHFQHIIKIADEINDVKFSGKSHYYLAEIYDIYYASSKMSLSMSIIHQMEIHARKALVYFQSSQYDNTIWPIIGQKDVSNAIARLHWILGYALQNSEEESIEHLEYASQYFMGNTFSSEFLQIQDLIATNYINLTFKSEDRNQCEIYAQRAASICDDALDLISDKKAEYFLKEIGRLQRSAGKANIEWAYASSEEETKYNQSIIAIEHFKNSLVSLRQFQGEKEKLVCAEAQFGLGTAYWYLAKQDSIYYKESYKFFAASEPALRNLGAEEEANKAASNRLRAGRAMRLHEPKNPNSKGS